MGVIILFLKAIILIEWLIIFSGWIFGLIKLRNEPSSVLEVDNPWKCRNYGILAFLAAFSGLLPFGKFSSPFHWTIILLAFLVSFLGPILYWWARFHLKKHWSSEARILTEHRLITNGPYRFIRHPIYLSKIILGFSSAIIFSSWIVFILAFLLIFSGVYQARTEEELLRKHFGKEYENYAKKVPMLFPNILSIINKISSRRIKII